MDSGFVDSIVHLWLQSRTLHPQLSLSSLSLFYILLCGFLFPDLFLEPVCIIRLYPRCIDLPSAVCFTLCNPLCLFLVSFFFLPLVCWSSPGLSAMAFNSYLDISGPCHDIYLNILPKPRYDTLMHSI